MKIPNLRTTLAAAFISVAVVIAGIAGCRAFDRNHVAVMLNIARVPASVSDIDCASYGFTDVLERCAFSIAPADFDMLLRGYHYAEPALCNRTNPVDGPCDDRPRTSHSYGGGPNVGRDFAVAHDYFATPREFEYGGNITLLTNRTRSLVMIDLYIE